MSNVKVNGNTYNDVTSVRLPLANGTGYAVYAEGVVTDDLTDILLSNEAIGDITNNTVSVINLSVFKNRTCGTLTFSNVAEITQSADNVAAENILFPKATKISSGFIFKTAKITGTLDLSKITTASSMNQYFYGSTIGTLLLGAVNPHSGMFQNATITNLVWNNTSANLGTGTDNASYTGIQGLNSSEAKFTNVYVPDENYVAIKALVDNGTITTITNLYKISEWSGE